MQCCIQWSGRNTKAIDRHFNLRGRMVGCICARRLRPRQQCCFPAGDRVSRQRAYSQPANGSRLRRHLLVLFALLSGFSGDDTHRKPSFLVLNKTSVGLSLLLSIPTGGVLAVKGESTPLWTPAS